MRPLRGPLPVRRRTDREPYGYDFSRCYLGPRGLLPVLDALSSDSSFTHLSLANCGLGCSAVERLTEWLQVGKTEMPYTAIP